MQYRLLSLFPLLEKFVEPIDACRIANDGELIPLCELCMAVRDDDLPIPADESDEALRRQVDVLHAPVNKIVSRRVKP